jgi:S-(hydroxymethyl)glutathione dehydrogenase/alcohol dehydrogenase
VSLHQFASLSGFADHVLVHERALVRIDSDIRFDVAALLGCAVVTGVGAVLNTAAVRADETVAVIGCGGVGINCLQGARLAGARQIIAIDTNPHKLERALLFGATDTVLAAGLSADELTATVVELSHGGVDHAFEAVGSVATATSLLGLTRRGGTGTLVGLLPAGARISVTAAALASGRRLQGSPMGSTRFRLDIPHYLDHYRAGRLMLDELVSAQIGLADVDGACDALLAGADVIRSVVVM